MTSSGSLLPAALCLLLISVPGSQTDGVNNVIACEGSVAQIKCDGGQVISVQSANYGREDQTTCSSGRPASQVRNVHCSNPASKVATSCDGQSSCSIRASNSEFGDPCVGTYKYLKVDYICESSVPGNKPQGVNNVISCEGSVAQLKCDGGEVISVHSADYGRRDPTTCASGRPSSQLQNIFCSNPTDKVAESCNGERSCSIKASNSEFGDPCFGTYKYLEVDYICQKPERHPQSMKSVTCEGSRNRLRCGSQQVLLILEANYGRRDQNTCAARRPSSQLSNIHCSNPAERVSRKCNGRRRCGIRASNSWFGDPCEGTYKYLEVDYTCMMKDVACEGSQAQLQCANLVG